MSGRVKRQLCYDCYELHNKNLMCHDDPNAITLAESDAPRGTQKHYSVPNRLLDETTKGRYKQGKCRAVVDAKWVTKDKDKVQCKQCRRSHEFRNITDRHEHERELLKKRGTTKERVHLLLDVWAESSCGAVNIDSVLGKTTENIDEVTCKNCMRSYAYKSMKREGH